MRTGWPIRRRPGGAARRPGRRSIPPVDCSIVPTTWRAGTRMHPFSGGPGRISSAGFVMRSPTPDPPACPGESKGRGYAMTGSRRHVSRTTAMGRSLVPTAMTRRLRRAARISRFRRSPAVANATRVIGPAPEKSPARVRFATATTASPRTSARPKSAGNEKPLGCNGARSVFDSAPGPPLQSMDRPASVPSGSTPANRRTQGIRRRARVAGDAAFG